MSRTALWTRQQCQLVLLNMTQWVRILQCSECNKEFTLLIRQLGRWNQAPFVLSLGISCYNTLRDMFWSFFAAVRVYPWRSPSHTPASAKLDLKIFDTRELEDTTAIGRQRLEFTCANTTFREELDASIFREYKYFYPEYNDRKFLWNVDN
jgi:hypothetical protein